MLAILTFVPQEAGPLLRRLSSRRRIASKHLPIYLGDFDGVPAALTIAGAGAANAVLGLDALRAAVPITAVAICGVAGGLDPSIRVGGVVLASQVRDVGADAPPLFSHTTPPPEGITLRQAPIVSVARVLVTREQKAEYAELGAAVDMETAAAAAEAARLGLPWCALRAISDAAEDDLPLDFNRCIAADGGIPLTAVLRELARHPAALPGMIRLGRATALASRRLAGAAEGYLPGWYSALG